MNSISMTDGGAYGYCVGGLNGIVHQTEQREIYRTIPQQTLIVQGTQFLLPTMRVDFMAPPIHLLLN